MKRIFLFGTYLICCCMLASATIEKEPEKVSFFTVPLICTAAPSIGCGSAALPILEKLEASEVVEEAWLNHTGTVIAVVWKGANPDVDQVQHIFKTNELKVFLMGGAEANDQALAFSGRTNWYRGKEVFQLSRIEAQTVAANLVENLTEENELSEEEKAQMAKEFENAFYSCFTDDARFEGRDARRVSNEEWAEYTRGVEKTIHEIGTRYLGDDMPEMKFKFAKPGEELKSCQEESSCCKKN